MEINTTLIAVSFVLGLILGSLLTYLFLWIMDVMHKLQDYEILVKERESLWKKKENSDYQ